MIDINLKWWTNNYHLTREQRDRQHFLLTFLCVRKSSKINNSFAQDFSIQSGTRCSSSHSCFALRCSRFSLINLSRLAALHHNLPSILQCSPCRDRRSFDFHWKTSVVMSFLVELHCYISVITQLTIQLKANIVQMFCVCQQPHGTY